MPTTVLTDDQMQLVTDCADDHDVSIRHLYSGRGMYGKHCLGLVFNDLGDLIGTILGIAESDSALAYILAAGVCTDSMGYSQIAYFPSIGSPLVANDDEDGLAPDVADGLNRLVTYTHPDPASERFIPPVVIDSETGADYDTLLTLLDGWVVAVHYHDNLAIEPATDTVRHNTWDDRIHLVDSDGTETHAIDLALVRWIQVL